MNLSWYIGTAKLDLPKWRVTKRTTGRWWWKQTLYDAENGIVRISNMTAEMAAMLTPQ